MRLILNSDLRLLTESRRMFYGDGEGERNQLESERERMMHRQCILHILAFREVPRLKRNGVQLQPRESR